MSHTSPHPESRRFSLIAPRLFDGALWHEDVTVTVADGRIVDVLPASRAGSDALRLPARTCLAPGFVDLQVNGGGGVLLNDRPDAAAAAAMVAAHRGFGTTGLLPTLITDRPEILARLADASAAIRAVPGVLGLHVEGPFINPARKGVHPIESIRLPDETDFASLARPRVHGPTIVTVAPEMLPPGTIARMTALGLSVWLGHSDASAADVAAACREGARGVTHLFNAMSQIGVRTPGLVGAALDTPGLMLGLICDGLHVDPVNLRIAYRCAGAGRLALVSDAMPSVGSASPTFALQGRVVTRHGARLTTADGTLAGAHLGMSEAVRNATHMMKIDIADALAMASRTPAASLGMADTRGRIAPGYTADLVAFTDDLGVLGTWIAGAWAPAIVPGDG